MFNPSDQQLFQRKGITEAQAESQIETFKRGFPYLNITKPATVGDGIIRLDNEEVDELIDLYQSFEGSRLKFVPASGAATRMFKVLFEFRESYARKGMECFDDKSFNSAHTFFENIKKFPFYSALHNELWSVGYNFDELIDSKDYVPIVDTLLNPDGLNYGNLPKGLLLFHRYGDIARTSLEEHLVEGAQYIKGRQAGMAMHLTVSPEHEAEFSALLDRVKLYYEGHYDITLNITYSQQKACTDTIAVNIDNTPFREADGSLLFRPGGHGALIENLNDLDADIIFIKNIDNVAPDRLKPQTVRYKKALAGLLISYQRLIFGYIQRITENDYNADFLAQVLDFVTDELCLIPPSYTKSLTDVGLADYLMSVLNRPLRVCGMVKNEGEPGGGPFWAKNPDGSISLQIVESSQVDLNSPDVKGIFSKSTHFNPVDLVCATKDWQGNSFNLLNYTDPATGFISTKSKDGKQLKALELPGLWNGAMSSWNTIFVEVPLVTFSPVKTVNDLLRPEHQEG